jgi:F0F1-type ATP synthase delta subunit
VKLTKRQLAARFLDALEVGTAPLAPLAAGLVAVAVQAGYTSDDLASLVAAVETQLQTRYASAEIQLTTARVLPAKTLRDIAAQVAVAAGLRHHSYTHHVDRSLLGGFEARAGDVRLRDSIRSNLEALEVRHG